MERNRSVPEIAEDLPINVSVLGCGWLGLALGKKLQSSGHRVKGSTTTSGKMPLLASAGIDPFLVNLDSDGIRGDIDKFLHGTDVLIISIPPGSRKGTQSRVDLIQKMKLLLRKIEEFGVSRVVFISSISVYKETEEIPEYTEASTPNGISGNAEVLKTVEKLFMDHPKIRTTIVRFGGLIGPDRHPVHHLSARKQVANPLAPVNLISLEDCVGILQSILEKGIFGELFNAVNPDHPGREEYYHHQALQRKIALPEFDHTTVSKGKRISSLKLERILGYRFRSSIWA